MRQGTFIVSLLFIAIVCICSKVFVSEAEKPHPVNISYPKAFGDPLIPCSNLTTNEGAWLGRLLFYDTLLSINGRMSCGTCHQQQFSFTDGRSVAIGVHGDTLKRNTMSLINLAWGQRFFWDGRVTTLEKLVEQPLTNPQEMGGVTETQLIDHLKNHPHYPELFRKAFPGEPISIATVSKAIAQFMRTIVSKVPDNATLDTFKVMMRREAIEKDPGNNSCAEDQNIVMEIKDTNLLKANSLLGSIARVSLMQCHSCHVTDGFGGQIVTRNENDSLFKAPNFMNVKYTAPYFHDGRFKTLKEVMQFYNDNMDTLQAKNRERMGYERVKIKFTEYDFEHADELFDSFSDSSINTNPAFSDPFKQSGFTWDGIKEKLRD